jgi:hypothetical protein
MDGSRFDAFTRVVARTSTRRALVCAIGGGGLATIVAAARGRMPAAAAPANPCPGGHLCSGVCCEGGFEACCGHKCVEIVVDPTHCHECGKTCPEGQTCCGSTCHDTRFDEANCGACGHACPKGATCANGVCHCPEGKTRCGSRCVDLQTNEHHCGSCATACTDANHEASCIGGACACFGSRVYCPGKGCTSLDIDHSDCGDCGHVCPHGTTCCGGNCLARPHCPSNTYWDLGTCTCVCFSSSVDGHCCAANEIARPGLGCCVSYAHRCDPAGSPCCSGDCRDGVCRCRKTDAACHDHADCCSGNCRDGVCHVPAAGGSCTSNSDCEPGANCDAGICQKCQDSTCFTSPGQQSHPSITCPPATLAACCKKDSDLSIKAFAYCCIPGENCFGDAGARLLCPYGDEVLLCHYP